MILQVDVFVIGNFNVFYSRVPKRNFRKRRSRKIGNVAYKLDGKVEMEVSSGELKFRLVSHGVERGTTTLCME